MRVIEPVEVTRETPTEQVRWRVSLRTTEEGSYLSRCRLVRRRPSGSGRWQRLWHPENGPWPKDVREELRDGIRLQFEVSLACLMGIEL